MALSRFVPELWSTRLIRHLDKALVYAQPGVINRNYEGEIRNQGDTVHISQIKDITVGPYTKGTPVSYQAADAGKTADLVIDQAEYFAVEVEDIDRVQANVNLMDQSVRRGAYALADHVDQYVAQFAHDVADAGNVIEGDVSTAAKAYETLVDLEVKLDEQNVPSQGRFAVIPPWFHGLLLKDDRFVASGAAMGDTRLRNGVVGEAAGFTLLKSNNVPDSTTASGSGSGAPGEDVLILAGSDQGITLATQITETEALRSQDQFSDLVRSLLVFGGVLVNEDELAVAVVDRPAASGSGSGG